VARCTIVIPCFNERGNIDELVAQLSMVARHGTFKFVLVDNGSEDKTYERCLELNLPAEQIALLRLERNMGYGGGILAGLDKADTELVGWMHADLQTPPSVLLSIPPNHLISNPRFIKGRRRNRPLFDRLLTGGMSLFESVLFRTPLWDINAQPTIFPRSLLGDLERAPSDFSLDLFVYLRAHRNGLDVYRLSVPFGPRFFGKSSWNTGLRARAKFIRRTLNYSVSLRREKR
jgi:glycosyltransferase involved in cell wall biosynthesis